MAQSGENPNNFGEERWDCSFFLRAEERPRTEKIRSDRDTFAMPVKTTINSQEFA